MALLLLLTYVTLTAGQDDSFTCTPQKTFPHPLDCSRYYYCDNNNIQQVFYCPPGLHYNPKTEACDLPDSSPCPYEPSLPATGHPSAVQLPVDEQPSEESALPGDDGQLGQSYISSIPLTGQSYSSLSADAEQPFSPSLREFGPSSLSSVPAQGEDTPFGQSFVSVFPVQGGPVFSPTPAEDRSDDVGDTVYENKTEETSDSYGHIFTALENFEKTLEEERNKEEGGDFVDVKRQATDEINVTSSLSDATQPEIGFAKEVAPEEVRIETVVSKDTVEESQADGTTTEQVKTESRCSADLGSFGRSAQSAGSEDNKTENSLNDGSVSLGDGDKEINTDLGSGDGDTKTNNPDVLGLFWPLLPSNNLTLALHRDSSVNENENSSYEPILRNIEGESQNITEEEKSVGSFPEFSVLNISETAPLSHTENNPTELFDENKEGIAENPPEKAEEIEEAKATIIFESHSEEKEAEIPDIPDPLSSVVIKETKILK